jgi:hypothetical protein
VSVLIYLISLRFSAAPVIGKATATIGHAGPASGKRVGLNGAMYHAGLPLATGICSSLPARKARSGRRMGGMRRAVLVLIVTLWALGACSHHVYSPPARLVPLQSPRTLAPGVTALDVEGAASGVAFSAGIYSGTLGISRGFADNIEVAGQLTYAQLGEASPAGTQTNGFTGHVGVKWAPIPKHLAFSTGVGGGSWAGGSFLAADGSAIVGWENCVIVPFFVGRLGVSVPMAAQAVDTAEGNDLPGTHVEAPDTTALVALAAGVKIPIGGRCEIQPRLELLGSFQIFHLFSSGGRDDGGAGLGAGIQIAF